MPEEAVAFPWPADAIEAAPGPCWAGVPAILHGRADEHRVAFREDAFSVAVTPAVARCLGDCHRVMCC